MLMLSARALGLDDRTVVDAVKASQQWWSEADVPDPLGYVDVRARPDLAAEAARRRAAKGSVLGHPRPMSYPKPAGGLRTMTRVDPVADVVYRSRVGRVIKPLEKSLGDNVFNTRTQQFGASWKSVPWRKAQKAYRGKLETFRSSSSGGEARLDVKNHYPTVSTETLRLTLNSAGAAPGAIDDLAAVLEEFGDIPGLPGGLPVGPEGSAPLGTQVLVPLDRVLEAEGLVALRWSDDLVVPLEGESFFEDVCGKVGGQLALGGQHLNLDKCEYVDHGDPTASEPSGGSGGPMLAADPVTALTLAAHFEVPTGVPFALGWLRRDHDPRGIPVLARNPWLIERFPKQTGRYLSDFGEFDDWDWAIEAVLAPTTATNAAAQMHLARVLPRRVLSPVVAGSIFDKACGLPRRTMAPLADQLFGVAGRSSERGHVRQRRALELGVELGELNAQRGLLSAFRDGGIDRTGTSGLAHMQRNQPDLAMTVAWVGAS